MIRCEAFGDESESAGGRFAIYSLIGFEPKKIESAKAILTQLKEKFGVPVSERLHCYVLFKREAREKTKWRVLKDKDTAEVCRQLSEELFPLSPLWSYGYVDLHELQALPTPDKMVGKFSGETGQVFSMDFRMKQAQKIAYSAAEIPFVTRFAKDVRFWIDQDGTKIEWFMGRRKAHNIHAGVGEPASVQVPEEYAPMLEIADLFAYAAGRHLSGTSSFGQHVFRTMHERYVPQANKLHLDPSLFGSEISTKEWMNSALNGMSQQ